MSNGNGDGDSSDLFDFSSLTGLNDGVATDPIDLSDTSVDPLTDGGIASLPVDSISTGITFDPIAALPVSDVTTGLNVLEPDPSVTGLTTDPASTASVDLFNNAVTNPLANLDQLEGGDTPDYVTGAGNAAPGPTVAYPTSTAATSSLGGLGAALSGFGAGLMQLFTGTDAYGVPKSTGTTAGTTSTAGTLQSDLSRLLSALGIGGTTAAGGTGLFLIIALVGGVLLLISSGGRRRK
jgi:hypothetical protein